MNSKAMEDLLSDHLPYELLMLRYTHGEIQRSHAPLLWNALFESFAAHARTLHEFLSGKADNRNGHASDFIEGFKPNKPELVRGKIDSLNQKIMHLGTTRKAQQDEKFDLGDARVLFDWIEAELLRFANRLPADLKAVWRPDLADPANVGGVTVNRSDPSATNHIQIMTSRVPDQEQSWTHGSEYKPKFPIGNK